MSRNIHSYGGGLEGPSRAYLGQATRMALQALVCSAIGASVSRPPRTRRWLHQSVGCWSERARPQFCDLAPAQVWARLLDGGIYLCSIAAIYRLLRLAGKPR